MTQPFTAKRIIKGIIWTIIALLSLLLFLIASSYLGFNPDVYFPQQRLVYMTHSMGIMSHIIGAMLTVLIGPFLFLPGLRRKRWLNIHRWLGRIYLLGVLIGGVAGLYMSSLAYGGAIAQLGFAFIGLLWLFTGFKAYQHIRNKRIEEHREWMMRNYAMTFAAVTLRLWQGVFQVSGVDFITGYMIVAWLSWIPNLLVIEGVIWRLRKNRTSRLKPI
jgi:hypothetical protein